MKVTRKEVGYAVWSRLEEAIRLHVREKLVNCFGDEWHAHVPTGIWEKVRAKEGFPTSLPREIDDPLVLLEETDMPDLMEIVCYEGRYALFFPTDMLRREKFREMMTKLYDSRCKIAHVKRSFNALDLDTLVGIAQRFVPVLGPFAGDLQNTVECIKTNPEKVVVQIPRSFVVPDAVPAHKTNLPVGDYDPDGGFIGRRDDLAKIKKLLLGDLHRVVTISGAGGVGKTALAHRLCQGFLTRGALPFDGIVWVSAKEEKLGVTGIEPIEPTVRNYEGLLDSILETFGWLDDLGKTVAQKEESVEAILRAGDRGVLLVVDNLETMHDDRVLEFIKDFPPPSRVLITSRLGLGEVERRYPLKELTTKDAIVLLRTVAREKGAESFARLPDKVLSAYVNKMSRYPLAIKWVVGQVALGRDVERTIAALTSPTGDIPQFCFEHIFNSMLSEDARVTLYALVAYDRSLTRGILTHVANLSSEDLDGALRELTIASFVIPTQRVGAGKAIETQYELLPLTRNYIHAKLQGKEEVLRAIKGRIETVQNLIEESEKAGRQYRYSLRDLGAQSDEEKVAATWAITAYQRYQAGDYDGAVEAFKKAAQIAPRFPAIYRNWAVVESQEGYHNRAEELMQRATSLAPKDARLWFVWGNTEKRRQRYDRAFEHLQKALELSPNEAPILGALGDVEKRRGNFESADGLLRKALETATQDAFRRRHQIVCSTSIAENLRRHAEQLRRGNRGDEANDKLKEAYSFARKAAELGKDDYHAQDTLRAVSLDLALQLERSQGLDAALPYFEVAISRNARRAKDRKTTVAACYVLTESLLQAGRADEARKYFRIGRRSLLGGSRYYDLYRKLGAEFSGERRKGALLRVITGKGYGFLELDAQTGQMIFLHISQVAPATTLDEFERMKGRTFTFLIEQTTKGPEAVRAQLCED